MAKNPKFEETVVRNQRGEFSDKDKTVTPTVRSTTKLPYEGGEQDYDSLTDERKDALAPGQKPVLPDWQALEDTDENREALLELARNASMWDGSCDWVEVLEPDNLMLSLGYQNTEAACNLCDAVSYGDYSPMEEYVRYDGQGNIESVSEETLMDEAEKYRSDIISELDDPETADEFDPDLVERIRQGEATREELLDTARQLNQWNGSCDWADAYDSLEYLTGVYSNNPEHDADWLACRVVYGDWYGNATPIRFDAYGNFDPVEEETLKDEAWERRDEILETAARIRDEWGVDDTIRKLTVM